MTEVSVIVVDINGGEMLRQCLASIDAQNLKPLEVLVHDNSVTNIGRSTRKLESQFLSMRLHVHYLRSLEDSERARVACVNYLQTWFPCFYPQRPDIVEQLEQLASNLGGQLRIPRLSWKYAWIQKIFGWKLAKEAQLVAQRRKEDLLRSWDKAMSQLENRT